MKCFRGCAIAPSNLLWGGFSGQNVDHGLLVALHVGA